MDILSHNSLNNYPPIFSQRPTHGKYKAELTVDASNAVGALAMMEFMAQLNEVLKITLVNDGSAGILNHQASCYLLCELNRE